MAKKPLTGVRNILKSKECEHLSIEDLDGKQEKLFPDGTHLYLRARAPSRPGAPLSLVWLFIYKRQGKLEKISLGAFGTEPPKVSLHIARRKADRFREWIALGKCPKAELQREEEERQAEKERLSERKTVKETFEGWMATSGTISDRKDKGEEVRRMFEKDVLPYIGDMHAEDVTKSKILGIVDRIKARGAARMSLVTFSLIRQMFTETVGGEGQAKENPTEGIKTSRVGHTGVERTRVLSEKEIKELKQATRAARLSNSSEAALWIALSTGCRIGELLKARWADVDLAAGTWVIPPENSKNGDPHTVYLSEFAARHFSSLKAISGESRWVYPASKGDKHVCPKSVTKQVADRQLEQGKKPMSNRSQLGESLKLSGGKWTPHDLRRTAATMMNGLGILAEVADKCLNHKEPNRIRRIYNQHKYEKEKFEAWRVLGERLDLLTRGDATNQIPIHCSPDTRRLREG